jgi:hypothetical protein
MVEVFLSRFVTIIADSKGRRLFITDGFSCYYFSRSGGISAALRLDEK